MDDESAVSLETPLPLFPAAGMSVASMSAAEHASWMERAPHKRLMLFLSWRPYGYQGMTAVIRLAEASRAAWAMIRSSISESLVGDEHDCTMNMSAPRIDSW